MQTNRKHQRTGVSTAFSNYNELGLNCLVDAACNCEGGGSCRMTGLAIF